MDTNEVDKLRRYEVAIQSLIRAETATLEATSTRDFTKFAAAIRVEDEARHKMLTARLDYHTKKRCTGTDSAGDWNQRLFRNPPNRSSADARIGRSAA